MTAPDEPRQVANRADRRSGRARRDSGCSADPRGDLAVSAFLIRRRVKAIAAVTVMRAAALSRRDGAA